MSVAMAWRANGAIKKCSYDRAGMAGQHLF
jgi:hypothetical protein